MSRPTPDEDRWIKSLRRVMAKRPATLGLWGGEGDLAVIALTEDGHMQHGSQSDEFVVLVTRVPAVAGGGAPRWEYLEDIDRPWLDDPTPRAKGDT